MTKGAGLGGGSEPITGEHSYKEGEGTVQARGLEILA